MTNNSKSKGSSTPRVAPTESNGSKTARQKILTEKGKMGKRTQYIQKTTSFAFEEKNKHFFDFAYYLHGHTG
jgi:hypothetical protein